jgi:hypothetical protein
MSSKHFEICCSFFFCNELHYLCLQFDNVRKVRYNVRLERVTKCVANSLFTALLCVQECTVSDKSKHRNCSCLHGRKSLEHAANRVQTDDKKNHLVNITRYQQWLVPISSHAHKILLFLTMKQVQHWYIHPKSQSFLFSACCQLSARSTLSQPRIWSLSCYESFFRLGRQEERESVHEIVF